MVGEGGSSGAGPDWVVIGGGIATVLGAVGAVIAGMNGAFKGKSSEAEQRQEKRDNAATANASLTLESVFRLVNELQEEVARKSADIERIERICSENKSALLIRIGELEGEVRRQDAEIRSLEAEIRSLKREQSS